MTVLILTTKSSAFPFGDTPTDLAMFSSTFLLVYVTMWLFGISKIPIIHLAYVSSIELILL